MEHDPSIDLPARRRGITTGAAAAAAAAIRRLDHGMLRLQVNPFSEVLHEQTPDPVGWTSAVRACRGFSRRFYLPLVHKYVLCFGCSFAFCTVPGTWLPHHREIR